jgi:protein-tyrosine phosphatase
MYNSMHPENPNRVLVHCAMGMSRSATAVIMFLMKLFHAKFEDIFDFVKNQRQATDPNEGFVEQLRKFEAGMWQFDDQPDLNHVEHNDQIDTDEQVYRLL